MIPNLYIWRDISGEGPEPVKISQPVWISESSPSPCNEQPTTAIGIRPIAPKGTFIGATIVPVELHARVMINGTPVGSGLHGLRHADCIALNGHRMWVAADLAVVVTTYDPAIHGERIYCFISKVPIQAGQEIVLCPGVPGKPCNVIYVKDAWERAMQAQGNMRCANCTFHPDDVEWRPTHDQPKKKINEFIDIHVGA